jgi:hypothetical protein
MGARSRFRSGWRIIERARLVISRQKVISRTLGKAVSL